MEKPLIFLKYLYLLAAFIICSCMMLYPVIDDYKIYQYVYEIGNEYAVTTSCNWKGEYRSNIEGSYQYIDSMICIEYNKALEARTQNIIKHRKLKELQKSKRKLLKDLKCK